jgi:hypothetical protein
MKVTASGPLQPDWLYEELTLSVLEGELKAQLSVMTRGYNDYKLMRKVLRQLRHLEKENAKTRKSTRTKHALRPTRLADSGKEGKRRSP